MIEFNEFISLQKLKSKSFHPFYEDALNYFVGSGKHFRGELMLCVVRAFRDEVLQDAFEIAFAIELMHTYSLIHDDLPCMDNAKLRRNKQTLHLKYDETTAVLVGDALNTHSFYLVANSKFSDKIKIKIIKSLSKNAGVNGMVLGQVIDCYFEKKRLSLDELTFLHMHKTGVLIASSLKIGGIICKLDKKICKNLYNLGLKLGLAFQINDDIIDVTKKSDQAGKTTQNDSDKNSFVNLLGLDKAKIKKNQILADLKNDLKAVENEKFSFFINELINKHLKD